MVKVAVDIGASCSKLVIVRDNDSLERMLIKTSGFLESATYLIEYAKKNHDFSQAAATGGGSSRLPPVMSGVSLEFVNELESIGAGGLLLSKLREAAVVSMGTGTAVLYATQERSEHLGGTGVGGGTLQGLSRLLIGEDDPEKIEALAIRGDHTRLDLMVGDIYTEGIGSLSPRATASNFAKAMRGCSSADLSSAIHSLVGQTVGTVVSMAARLRGAGAVVPVGTLTRNKYLTNVVTQIVRARGFHVVVPENAEYAPALGALHVQERKRL